MEICCNGKYSEFKMYKGNQKLYRSSDTKNDFGEIGLNFNFRFSMDPYYLRISTAYDNTPGDMQIDGTNKRTKTDGSITYYSTFSSQNICVILSFIF